MTCNIFIIRTENYQRFTQNQIQVIYKLYTTFYHHALKHTHTENTDINVINNDKKRKLKGSKFDFRISIQSLSFVFRES